jgi:hypothetical protein
VRSRVQSRQERGAALGEQREHLSRAFPAIPCRIYEVVLRPSLHSGYMSGQISPLGTDVGGAYGIDVAPIDRSISEHCHKS